MKTSRYINGIATEETINLVDLFNRVESLQEYFEQQFGLYPENEELKVIQLSISNLLTNLYHEANGIELKEL